MQRSWQEDDTCLPWCPQADTAGKRCLCLFALRKGVKPDPAMLLCLWQGPDTATGTWQREVGCQVRVPPVSASATGSISTPLLRTSISVHPTPTYNPSVPCLEQKIPIFL